MNISQILLSSVKHISPLTFILAFAGGFILSFSSCTLVRIPVILGFMGGATRSRQDSIKILTGFCSGLVISYTLLGIAFGLFSWIINRFPQISVFFYYGGGITLFVLGLYLLGFIPHWHKKNLCVYSSPRPLRLTFWGALIFGVTFAFLEAPVCPCCGPALLVLATATFTQAKFISGILLFFTYALGQSTPIFTIGLSASLLKFSLKNLSRIESYIELIAGVILVYFGIYLLLLA